MQELTEEMGKRLLAMEPDELVKLESPMPGLTDRPVTVVRNARLSANRMSFVGHWMDLKFMDFEVLLLDGRYKYTILP